MNVAAIPSGAVSQLSTQRQAPPSLALPPYIASVTPTDLDGDGDTDTGTILDTFA